MAQPYQPGPTAAVDGPAPGVRFAGAVPRLVAYLIDGLIAGAMIALLGIVLGTVIGLAGSGGRDFIVGLGFILYFITFFLVGVLYFPFFWAMRAGQTPGMKLMKIRVVRDEDGGPVGWGPALLRLVGYAISGAVFYLGFLWILVDKRKRGWHDLIAGTCVVEA